MIHHRVDRFAKVFLEQICRIVVAGDFVDGLLDLLAGFEIDRVLRFSSAVDHIAEVQEEFRRGVGEFAGCDFPLPGRRGLVAVTQMGVADDRERQFPPGILRFQAGRPKRQRQTAQTGHLHELPTVA